MPYGECKIYFDGSHYIGIPHTTRPPRKSVKPPDEEFVVPTQGQKATLHTSQESRTVTRKELFEESYKEAQSLPKKERKEFIEEQMGAVFQNKEGVEKYVEANIRRKKNNLISKRIRMVRKANLQEFNYFCTFTYDDKKHSEQSFRKKLSQTFWNMSKRKGWKYIGVWERSPEKQRLHFHGIFYMPNDDFPGDLVERKDYSFAEHKRKVTMENTYFKENFGRNDFEVIEDQTKVNDALAYLMKYISKTGERIVYSRGLPQFFISDIMDDDVICRIGLEEKKLLLFDNFDCWDEGEYIGKVGKETISKLRKGN